MTSAMEPRLSPPRTGAYDVDGCLSMLLYSLREQQTAAHSLGNPFAGTYNTHTRGTMESATAVVRQPRGRVNVNGAHDPGRPRQLHSRNKQWVAGENGERSGTSTPYHSDGERWERGGHKGGRGTRGVPRGGRAKYPNVSFRALGNGHELSGAADAEMDDAEEVVEEEEVKDPEELVLETAEEREKFWQEVRRWGGLMVQACGILKDGSVSWSKDGKSRGKRPLLKGRWTIRISPRDWRTRFVSLERAWICALALNGTEESEKTTFSNGKLYVRVDSFFFSFCICKFLTPNMR